MYPVPRISASHAPWLGHVAESDRRQVPQRHFNNILPYVLLPRFGDVAESDRRQVPQGHFNHADYPLTTNELPSANYPWALLLYPYHRRGSNLGF